MSAKHFENGTGRQTSIDDFQWINEEFSREPRDGNNEPASNESESDVV